MTSRPRRSQKVASGPLHDGRRRSDLMLMTMQPRRLFTLSLLVAAGLTGLILALDPLLDSVPHPPDRGPWWYFWRLAEPTFLSRASAWIGYGLHQISLWIVLILLARKPAVPGRVSPLNVAALLVNLFFVLLHILQTHLFYDGLAQDVPVWTSQWSVIIMLIIVIYQATPLRGFILGKRLPWNQRGLRLSHRFHGFYISWALIQLSFARTEIHLSLAWIVLLELLVGIHGPAIAIQKMIAGGEGAAAGFGPGTWIMFLSGFLFMFAFTGQYGLRWSRPLRALVIVAYLALVVGLFAWWDLGRLYMVTFIPVALYGGALVYGGIFELLARIRRRPSKATPS